MVCNKIDACITTFNFDLTNIDIEKSKDENENLMSIIQNMKFDGTDQQLSNKINSADCQF